MNHLEQALPLTTAHHCIGAASLPALQAACAIIMQTKVILGLSSKIGHRFLPYLKVESINW